MGVRCAVLVLELAQVCHTLGQGPAARERTASGTQKELSQVLVGVMAGRLPQDPDHPARELALPHTPQTRGWQCPRYGPPEAAQATFVPPVLVEGQWRERV